MMRIFTRVTATLGVMTLLVACGGDEEDTADNTTPPEGSNEQDDADVTEIEEMMDSYYGHLVNNEYDQIVDYISDDLLDNMQMDEQAFVENTEENAAIDYSVDSTVSVNELVTGEAYGNHPDLQQAVEDFDPLYRVRVDVLYEEQDVTFAGIDDAFVAEVDDEWQVFGILTFQNQ